MIILEKEKHSFMYILKGKKTIEIDDLTPLIKPYETVIVDIGTGNGRYPYTYGKNHPEAFAIGIDPAGDNMVDYSVKSQKKPAKGGLSNVLFTIASVESLPDLLYNIGHQVTVNLPWGSLLEGIVKGEDAVLKGIVKVGRNNSTFSTIFSYTHLHESGEIDRRDLPELSLDYIKAHLQPIYEKAGIIIDAVTIIDNEALKDLNTLWAKKLMVSKKREIFSIKGRIIKKS